MSEYDALYPDISQSSGENFRLHKVNMVLSQLGSEHKHYEHVRKKYARIRSVFHASAITTGVLSGILTASGIGTSLTGPGVVFGIPLSAVGCGFGLISAGCGFVIKKLTKKISKHERTIQLIQSKENTISDLVSKALHDNQIDEKEFELIMSELQKYETLKATIRRDEFLKNEPVNVKKLRQEIEMNIKKEMIEKLTNPKN